MPSQREVLQMYAALKDSGVDWEGTFLLSIGLDDAGRSRALATLAAGAATLVLEEDSTLLRAANRDVSFTVTTLDEALRALKNEVRQRRAITVALAGGVERWLDEMVSRGVQPDVVMGKQTFVSLTKLLQRGATCMEATDPLDIAEDVAETVMERRQRDVALLWKHPDQRQWLEAAPTLFPRDLVRCYLNNEGLKPLPKLA